MQTKNSMRLEVYAQYYDRVFGYVLNRVRNRADAEDITSEVFLKLFSKPDGVDLRRPGASTYIFRVTQTTLADHYRNNRIVFEPLEEIADEIDDMEDYDGLLVALDKALGALSEREQAIVILHYYHGLNHREISQRMGISYVNAQQLCHVALQKIRKELVKTI